MIKLELVSKAAPGSKETRVAEAFQEDFIQLLERSQYSLNQYVEEDEVEIEEDEIREPLQRMLDHIVVVYSCVDLEQFFGQLEKEKFYDTIDQFLDWVKEYAESAAYAWNSTQFMREADRSEVKELISYCFQEYVLYTNPFNRMYGSFSKEQMQIIVKIFYTMIEMRIADNYSERYMRETTYDMFVWDDELFQCFWSLIEENRDRLWRNVIMQKVKKIADDGNK